MEMISRMWSDKDEVEVTFKQGENEKMTTLTKKEYKALIKDKK